MEDSPMDTPDLWMSERNEEEPKFERTRSDDMIFRPRNTPREFHNSPEYKEPDSLKPEDVEDRQMFRKPVVKRFLHENYVVKKHNHTRDYTIDMCMHLCPISFQDMHKTDSHMYVFF
jgi:hypothetical protein